MARRSVPIPSIATTQPPNRRRGNNPPNPPGEGGVMRSSLELVFSYSRSQQRFFGGLPSAPSFVDYPRWEGHEGSSDDEENVRVTEWDHDHTTDEEYHEDESHDDESHDENHNDDDGQSTPDHPTFFQTDPDPIASRRSSVVLATPPVPSDAKHTRAVKPVQAPRRGFMSFFSPQQQPVVNLSSSVGSSGSQTPRPLPARRLPDVARIDDGSVPPSNTGQGGGSTHPGHRAFWKGSDAIGGETIKTTPTENTPLLVTPSPSATWAPEHLSPNSPGVSPSGRRRSLPQLRRSSVQLGQSTDGQTLFNAVAVLVGIGLLSMPLAFSYAGWIGGTGMLVGFSYITCHTAKLLARLIFADRNLRGYTDIGKKAFGSWASGAINILFCLELFALGVALVVLFGDSLNVVLPALSSNTYKLIGFFLILPTTFMPLSLLSLPSLLSTVSSFLLVIIIFIDGFWKSEAPGSIRHPMPTSWTPEMTGMNWLGAIGLILAGFGGHAVVPSLARDMRHPESFERVINVSFAIAAAISFVTGAAGYLMIGDTVSDEITRDLMEGKYNYPKALNVFALWMIVINPLSKFGLCSRPLNVTIESILSLAPSPIIVQQPSAIRSSISAGFSAAGASDYIPRVAGSGLEDPPKSPVPLADGEALSDTAAAREGRKGLLRILSRTTITACCTATAILLPGFGRVMAFLGSFSAFLICIILPLLFYLRLGPRLLPKDEQGWAERLTRLAHMALLVVSMVLMTAGTAWAFIPSSGRGRDV